VIAAFEHLIGSPGCHDLSLAFIFADQQIGGSPDVSVGDHSGSSRWQITRPIKASPYRP
jgi:hypothetical protein